MKTLETDVCIAGGGPAGMLLALLLAKMNIRVHVLEKQKNFDREYRGEILQPRFLQMLDQLGLKEYLEKFPHEKLKQGAFFVHDHQIGSINFQNVYSGIPYAISMPQPVLLQALYEKAAEYPSFELSFHASVMKMIMEEGVVKGVTVKCVDEEFDIRAKITIGADGRFSTLRRLMDYAIEYEQYSMDLIWFTIEHPEHWERMLRFQISNGPTCIMGSKYGNRLQVGIAFKREEWDAIKQQGIEAFKQTIINTHPYFKDFASSLTDFKPFTPLQSKLFMVKQWAKDGCLLIGDAAHCATPIGAVGVSLSCATAVIAADVIVKAINENDFSAGMLNLVQKIREPEIRKIHAFQKKIENVMVDSPVLRKIRPIAITLLAKTPLFTKIQKRMLLMPTPLPIDPQLSFNKQ
ncbi:FAD-dependent monooxygenase [Paenibacillus sp. FSL R10-2782]|uniref:FAD-dependent monooxygenase n=1 Tax=Paenibacillus sp. FSL R10-2782 TaxID=2954661 RepID=UPI00315915FF